jgi:uncharacterized protein (DUF924 family)
MSGQPSSAEILHFWFGDDPARALDDPTLQRLWWAKQPAVDAAMRERFGAQVRAAGEGALDGWAATPDGQLALILLTDQFPRNIFRDTPAAFALDPVARRWALQGIEQGVFDALHPVQQVFAWLPLEHAEDAELQARCVQGMRTLRERAPASHRAAFDSFVDFAERHEAVIRRFGRFPHRNAILGRDSTDEERAFLATPGSSF